ncbi:MAG: phosphoribosylaminoimidazolesuccinocarboxamide synthase [Phycisphaerales bacterium]|nr:phosphoribosylaminoimidazolesuccinocarboxamide synthase [Phycisphaerales bacterium]
MTSGFASIPPVFQTNLPLGGRRQGKVRDLYSLSPDADGRARLLVVASDRISAFDVVMPTPVGGKGALLTALSLGWFAFLRARGIVNDHVLQAGIGGIAELDALPAEMRATLVGRTMVCRAAKVVQIECVARGYLAGSGWNEYRASGTVCGIALPAGLRQCEQLPEPIFTPAIKAETGHDENVSFDGAAALVGGETMERLRALTLSIYSQAAQHARDRGVILADTKFEFGFELDPDGRPTNALLLVDEVLTPDSSRYWPADLYAAGRDQPSFDKQFLRNWLLELVAAKKWDKEAPGPELPAEVVQQTLGRYLEALDRLGLEELRRHTFRERLTRSRFENPPQGPLVPSTGATIIDGRLLSNALRAETKARIVASPRGVRLDAVMVGEDPSSAVYAENQAKTCHEVGVDYRLHRIGKGAGFDEIAGRILLLNRDSDVRAIMLHLPLPEGVETERIQSLIAPEKDVEGVNPANIGNVVYGRRSLVPCTALAALEMIESTGIVLRGARCVIVGASNIVGKPIAVLLMRSEATVLSTNKYTTNLAELTRGADVIVAAAGVPGLITKDMVKPGAVVIDVGINRVVGANGKTSTVGDVDFQSVREVAGFLSPVPGGVGPMTVAMLLRNVVDATLR